MHSPISSKSRGEILKIDFSKAFDKVNWLYLRMLLTHLGFEVPFINWIKNCITSVSFDVLINGSASNLFLSKRGLRQGFPLSPLLFLLVAKGLSRALEAAKSRGEFSGITTSPTLQISHLLFVDDVLIFCSGNRRDVETFMKILDLFWNATWMKINSRKSTLSTYNLDRVETNLYKMIFPFDYKEIEEGLKYLGFHLNPNKYRKEDWSWLLEKLERRLKVRSFR
jgi:hypothetical protein